MMFQVNRNANSTITRLIFKFEKRKTKLVRLSEKIDQKSHFRFRIYGFFSEKASQKLEFCLILKKY